MFKASSYLPRESRYLGDSGSSRRSPATMKEGMAHISKKIRHELYLNADPEKPISLGIINHANPKIY